MEGSVDIRLVSSDGVEFVVGRDAAMQSRVIDMFLDSDAARDVGGMKTIELPIRSKYLGRIVEFMIFRYSAQTDAEFHISDDETMELLEIASYLKI